MTIDIPIGHGSITKVITGAAIMALQEEGLLSIDDNIVQYMPQSVIDNWNNRWDTTDWQMSTIRDLLAHTSGIPEFVDFTTLYDMLTSRYKEYITPEDCITTLMPDSSEYMEYGIFNYSNTNYMLLGMICSNITGMNWTDCIHSYSGADEYDLLVAERYFVERGLEVWPGYTTYPFAPFNWTTPENTTKHFNLGMLRCCCVCELTFCTIYTCACGFL